MRLECPKHRVPTGALGSLQWKASRWYCQEEDKKLFVVREWYLGIAEYVGNSFRAKRRSTIC